eukprot:TRINITY_DN10108_c0_g1_i1.p1 TRINITY_DN10108_c0_g1~~TRINITY_DN10108_c0_g1_i1.p1  ORF type:complete len:346 (-),score=14.38 TRINITY_DN10108_c0_g1_i1:444-1481(-)
MAEGARAGIGTHGHPARLLAPLPFPQAWALWADRWEMLHHAHPTLVEQRCLVPLIRSYSELQAAVAAACGGPLQALPPNNSLHFFRHGVLPSYAQGTNRRGGHFTVRFIADDEAATAAQAWWSLAVAAAAPDYPGLTRPPLPNPAQVVGVTYMRKPQTSALKLWMKDAKKKQIIAGTREVLSHSAPLPHPPPFVKFSPHRFVIASISGQQQPPMDLPAPRVVGLTPLPPRPVPYLGADSEHIAGWQGTQLPVPTATPTLISSVPDNSPTYFPITPFSANTTHPYARSYVPVPVAARSAPQLAAQEPALCTVLFMGSTPFTGVHRFPRDTDEYPIFPPTRATPSSR